MAPEPYKNGRKRFIMANKITKSEMDTIVRGGAISILGIDEKGTQIGTSTYAIPVETPEGVFYAKVAVTAAQRTDTKVNPAFDLEVAVEKYAAECAETAKQAAAREAEKAARKARSEAAKAEKEAKKAQQ